jgi:putative ABC transport system ATP-binding protein
MNTLEEINTKDQKTVILVTHDAKLLPYAHRVYHLKDGAVEREVVNPEKKQIKQVDPGTSILSEIEKLARIYPYSTPEELRVKSIVNFLTQEIGFDQIERLEKTVGMFIDGKLTNDGFVDRMTKSVEAGGPEIPKERAEAFKEKVNIILKEARDIRSYRDNFTAKVASPRQAERIAEIREELMREFHFSLSPDQVMRMDELLKFRIRGFIQSEDFRRRLETPFVNEGIGIDNDTARNASWYLEKLIGQGMYL